MLVANWALLVLPQPAAYAFWVVLVRASELSEKFIFTEFQLADGADFSSNPISASLINIELHDLVNAVALVFLL